MTTARSTERKRAWRKVFLAAADRVQRRRIYGSFAYSGDGIKNLPSCKAIEQVGGSEECLRWYQRTMLDDEIGVSHLWGDGAGYSEESYQGRLLLLCMAATIVGDER